MNVENIQSVEVFMKGFNSDDQEFHASLTAMLKRWKPDVSAGAGKVGSHIVIYQGDIFISRFYVMAGQCPGNLARDGSDYNPWHKLGKATAEQIVKAGNTADCAGKDFTPSSEERDQQAHKDTNKPDKNDQSDNHGNPDNHGKPDDSDQTPKEDDVLEPSFDEGTCDKNARVKILHDDTLTIETYQSLGLKELADNPKGQPYLKDGSGYHLSFTSTRVAGKSLANEYRAPDKSQGPIPTLTGYYTDWAQYDARLDVPVINDPSFQAKESGRGFDVRALQSSIDKPPIYNRLVFSFMGIFGDTGVKSATINGSGQRAGYDKGHALLLDPWGDLLSRRNVTIGTDRTDTLWQYDLNTDRKYTEVMTQQRCAGALSGLRDLKKASGPQLKLAFSIGGWSMSGYFSIVFADPKLRKVFVNSIVKFFHLFPMFDAVDLDWEYPGGHGLEGNACSKEDGNNYVTTVRELRNELDRHFISGKKEITIACSADIDKIIASKVPELADSGVDNVYVMTYDFFGSTWAAQLAHHTNLMPSGLGVYSTHAAVQYLLEHNVKSSQIHVGYAAYGRSARGANLDTLTYVKDLPEGVRTNNDPLSIGTFEGGSVEFYDAMYNYLDLESCKAEGKNGFILYTDTSTGGGGADLLYNPHNQLFISLDTPRTVKLKGDYVREHKLGGLFVWSADQDSNSILANAAREGMGYIAEKTRFDMSRVYNKGRPIQLSLTDRHRY